MKLTKNEVEALKICLNYETREAQLEDNYSNGGAQEFAVELFDGNMKAAGGLITSLQEKGMGVMDEEDDIFWLSEEGVNTIFDILEGK